MFMYVCVCVCMCVCERERESFHGRLRSLQECIVRNPEAKRASHLKKTYFWGGEEVKNTWAETIIQWIFGNFWNSLNSSP